MVIMYATSEVYYRSRVISRSHNDKTKVDFRRWLSYSSFLFAAEESIVDLSENKKEPKLPSSSMAGDFRC